MARAPLLVVVVVPLVVVPLVRAWRAQCWLASRRHFVRLARAQSLRLASFTERGDSYRSEFAIQI